MCGKKGKREIRSSQNWKKSQHGNILTSLDKLAGSLYYDVRLTRFL